MMSEYHFEPYEHRMDGNVECMGCEEQCLADVHRIESATKVSRFVICEIRDDTNRVEVEDNWGQW